MSDTEDWGEDYVEPRRFRKVDLVGFAFHTASQIVAAIADGLEGVADTIAAHTNWLDERDDFANQAIREMESLTAPIPEED